jgi:predicted dehydrogenase
LSPMRDKIGWGILGAGKIARRFAADLVQVPGARLVAVGSQSADRASALAREFGLDEPGNDYASLVRHPEVDVVYVATRHPGHFPAARLALEAGRAVLCEKPLTMNGAEAKQLVDLARRRSRFLMEGMWTRCFPLMRQAREMAASGALGDVRRLDVDFGFHAEFNPEGRLFDPAKGGGALLDVGVYALSLASLFFGAPRRATGQAWIGKSGVDEQIAMVLDYPGGQLAVLMAAVCLETSKETTLWGTLGNLRIHAPFWKPHTMTWTRADGSHELISSPYRGHGFQFEIEEVMRCVREGAGESPCMPLDESVAVQQTMDQLRAQWGLRYPMES